MAVILTDEDDISSGVTRGFSPCGKTKKQRFVCSGGIKVCGARITTGEDSVMCDICKEWFHLECLGLSTRAPRFGRKFCDDPGRKFSPLFDSNED